MSDFAQLDSGGGEICTGCGERIGQNGLSCENCGALRFDRSGTLELAPHFRRLAAYLIDTIGIVLVLAIVGGIVGSFMAERIENEDGQVVEVIPSAGDQLVIVMVVLVATMLAWLWSAPRGQSPGMRMLGLYLYRTSGGTASTARVLARDLWPSGVSLLFAVIALVVGDSVDGVLITATTAIGAVYVVSSAWVLWQRDRRALHDFAFDTVVVQQRQTVLGVPVDGSGGQSRHGHPSPPGELPPDR